MSETKTAPAKTEGHKDTHDGVAMVHWFQAKEKSGDPGYDGFGQLAEQALQDLENTALRARSGDAYARGRVKLINLRPESDGPAYQMVKGREKKGSHALISKLYELTGADDNMLSHLEDKRNDASLTVTQGEYMHEKLYFIEMYSHGGLTVMLTAERPEAYIPKSRHELPKFYTHSERIEHMEPHIAEIESLPTSEVKEEELVANWLHKQHRGRKTTH